MSKVSYSVIFVLLYTAQVPTNLWIVADSKISGGSKRESLQIRTFDTIDLQGVQNFLAGGPHHFSDIVQGAKIKITLHFKFDSN